ncbi:MAG: DMT family transporter [Synechococcaceae cyanobacterium ELA739]
MKLGAYLLAVYILLRGSDSTVLKALQQAGSLTHRAGGPEAISFCNVFFFSSLICGLAMVSIDRRGVTTSLPRLKSRDLQLLALQGLSGFFLGPVAFFLTLDHLGVVQQTLLFSLTVPLTALGAHWWLQERLPRSFPFTCALLSVGLLLSHHGQITHAGGTDGPGVLWALVGVMAFVVSGLLARCNDQRGWGVGLTVGINSLGASVLFGLIALVLFGPNHFLYLRLWWVLGVIAGYGMLITLGSQWSLMAAYRRLGVVPVTLWASLTIVVALSEAHLLLHEPIGTPVLLGAGLIVAAIALHQATSRPDAQSVPHA